MPTVHETDSNAGFFCVICVIAKAKPYWMNLDIYTPQQNIYHYMKRIFFTISLALMLAVSAFSQEYVDGRDLSAKGISKSDPSKQFRLHGFIELSDGFSWTVQHDFASCLTNNVTVAGGCAITPVISVRGSVGYSEGRRYEVKLKQAYGYDYITVFADVLFNFSNLFGGYRHDRVVDAFPYAGIGTNIGLRSRIGATPEQEALCNYSWNPGTPFFAWKVGGLLNFRITDNIHIIADLFANLSDEKLDSRHQDHLTTSINGLVGIRYNFGKTTRKAPWVLEYEARKAKK